jgi:hypothetical protein
MTPHLLLTLVLLAIACGVAACSPASAEPEDGLPLVEVQGLSPDIVVPRTGGSDLEQLEGLAYPPLDIEVHEVIEQLQGLADSSGDGIPALERDPVRIRLYWYGLVPRAVQDVIEENTDVVVVEVVPTPYRYGDLLDEALRLIAEHQPAVAAVGPRPQGDGINITIRVEAVDEAGGLDAVLAGIDTSYPLFAGVGDVVPASAG